MRIRSLNSKLALYYVALSLLALFLVKSTILLLEFRELRIELDRGVLARAVEEGSEELRIRWAREPRPTGAELERALESLLLRLEQPHALSSSEATRVLMELSSEPLAAQLVDPQGRTLAEAPPRSSWKIDPLARRGSAWSGLNQAKGARLLLATDSPELMRLYAAPVQDAQGTTIGTLLIELRLPLPWRKLSVASSLEWRILLAYLLVFSVGSGFFLSRYVTARLNRIGAAASAWRRGDFSLVIEDLSTDEFGRIANELNGMAADLRALVLTRARLASLEERQRLARDLHDTVKQKAFALNLQLATAGRLVGGLVTPLAARIEEARRISEEIQSELAQILDELRVPEPSVALAQRLATKVEDFSRRSGITADAELTAADRVPVRHHEALTRIVDEALANAMRHSGATHVALGLQRIDEDFSLTIRDNGCGGAADSAMGMGVRNMRDRAELLPHGRFEMLDAADAGTLVKISWTDPDRFDR
ncbi:MAG: sensor histidine kinase [Lysobacterales bacterium]